MARQKSTGSETAFAYMLNFNDLHEIAKRAGYQMYVHGTSMSECIDKDVFVTGLDGKCIQVNATLFLSPDNFNHIFYSQLLIALENDLQDIAKIADKVSRTYALMQQRLETPIMRPKRNIPALQKLGIQLWHHLLFTGNYVIAYIWDTRVIDRIYTIAETSDFSKRMFHTEPYDNNQPIILPEWLDNEENYAKLAILPSLHPCLRSMSAIEELENELTETMQNEQASDDLLSKDEQIIVSQMACDYWTGNHLLRPRSEEYYDMCLEVYLARCHQQNSLPTERGCQLLAFYDFCINEEPA